MAEYYLEIRNVHILAVMASGGLFFLRGLGLILAAQWPRTAPLRYLSYTIDTVLLTAALMLMTIVRQYPFVHAWLTVKVLLLAAYVVTGVFAFQARRSRPARIALWLLALGIYLFIISVARTHNPLGALHWL